MSLLDLFFRDKAIERPICTEGQLLAWIGAALVGRGFAVAVDPTGIDYRSEALAGRLALVPAGVAPVSGGGPVDPWHDTMPRKYTDREYRRAVREFIPWSGDLSE